MDKTDIKEKLIMAREGRELWLDVEKKYGIDYTKIVIIMPHANDIINAYSIQHLKKILEFKHAEEAIIVITELEAEALERDYLEEGTQVEVITEKQMISLMKYNDLCTFSSQMTIVSFTYGCDCDIRRILKNSTITLEEAVCIGILGLSEYCEVKA